MSRVLLLWHGTLGSSLNASLGKYLKCLCNTVVRIAVLVPFSMSVASIRLPGILSHLLEGGKGHSDLLSLFVAYGRNHVD